MKRFTQLTYILLLLLYITACRKDPVGVMQQGNVDDGTSLITQPNIILILADDVGYDIPNYTGGQSFSTPNMNYLAANGTQFTECHTAPMCSPSRFMLMTAKYNFRNYATWGTMDTSQRTIANLMKKAGYATCMAGKWQFDGGDTSIRKFGFDKYLVTNPFNVDVAENGTLKFYKDPQIYENGAYWPDSLTSGKYGDDLIKDYMFNFIDSNKGKKPFFIYWATNLVHEPFSPTPDDPEFATWNSDKKKSAADSVYYPSMVKYLDKLIGQLVTKVNTDRKLQNKTLILFLGDNGSTADVTSIWNGQVVRGDKSGSTEAGTHVPLLAYMPGRVLPGVTDTSLISSVDFMSTIGDMAGVKIPKIYGTTDGLSFAPQFQGDYSNVRPWIFCHFIGSGKNETDPAYTRRWMQDHTYKQYDSLLNPYSKKFFNIVLDPLEQNPIPKSSMTTEEKAISKQFLANMKQLH